LGIITALQRPLTNVDRFSKFFHQLICKKIMYTSQRFPPHLQCVASFAILPCEILKSNNVD